MKSNFRLLLCLLCAVLLCLPMTSCQNKDAEVPEGMMIASYAGADYKLYVPTTWNLNTSFGVSSAFRNLNKQSTVSVNRYPITDGLRAEMTAALTQAGKDPTVMGERIGWYFENYCAKAVSDRALSNKLTFVENECVASDLGGKNGYSYRYRAIVNGVQLEIRQVITEFRDAFYVFSFVATDEMYGMFSADVDKMLEYFEFTDEPYYPEDFAKKLDSGKNAPAGMKSAFGKDVAYCFYVPNSWEISMDESVYAAYVPADRTNVIVAPYMPTTEQMSVVEYIEMSKSMMEKLMGEDFVLISDTAKAILGGRQATVMEFTLKMDGVVYRYRQYVAAYKSMIYTLTYTATEDHYNEHLADLDAIVAAFTFR